MHNLYNPRNGDTPATYKSMQPPFFFLVSGAEGLASLICLIKSWKIWSTLFFVLAEASRKVQLLNFLARLSPCSVEITRWSCKSHLFPTKTMGTESQSFTLRICSRKSGRSLNVDCAIILYTRTKPCPFFMYKSLIAVNCSVPAVS